MMELLELYFIFFKIGLFTIGGGLAAIPLLQEAVVQYGWFPLADFFNMIAVSESTPGPIGVNIATYVGFTTAGVPGALVATLGIISPSFFIILLIAKFFLHFNRKPIVRSVFYGLRPGVTGLIATAAAHVVLLTLFNLPGFKESGLIFDLFNLKGILIFLFINWAYHRFDLHPIVYIGVGAVLGILFL